METNDIKPNKCNHCGGSGFIKGFMIQAAFMYGENTALTRFKNMFSTKRLKSVNGYQCKDCGNLLLFIPG
jgi:hypothetical protein